MRRVILLASVLLTSVIPASLPRPVLAQQAGASWRQLIPELQAKLTSHADPGVGFRLAMVYAHEGLILDGWHMLKQVDKMIGGPEKRDPVARKIIADASQDVQRDPHDLLARYSLAFASWLIGDHDTPYREFLEISRQEPQNSMNHGYLGYIYSTRSDAKNTIIEWETGTRLDPSNSVLHYMLGSAYYRTGRTREAIHEFRLAYRDRTLYTYITRGEEP
jgi:tetratricopeptide (TPR) repeat protein